MKSEDKIRDRFGTETGFKVPDGYFDQVFASIESQLPEMSELPKPKPLTTWQRIKPYVYLAAMFGGIWCTMKMVNMVSESHTPQVSLDNPPAMVAQAMSDPEIAAQVCPSSTVMIVEEDMPENAVEGEEELLTSDTENSSDTDNAEVTDSYEEFVEISDIDLNQLRASLDKDETINDIYYI